MTALITPAWLMQNLRNSEVRILDATFTLPGDSPTGQERYLTAHIPGARYFDVKTIADTTSPYPSMLPDAATFGQAVGALGISNRHTVVVYDSTLLGAARVWWMFRAFGHAAVKVLDGGLSVWQAAGGAVTDVLPPLSAPEAFVARLQSGYLATFNDMQQHIAKQDAHIIDLRSPARFSGAEAEPRPGMRSGHMPGSVNIHYKRFFAADGMMLPSADLARLFAGAGLAPDRPLVATCGSGISAPIAALAAHELGQEPIAVYDGSWSEWGSRQDTAVATGVPGH
jgi:thiosulfate/3-mercaptopyruvate sulfurtransferase